MKLSVYWIKMALKFMDKITRIPCFCNQIFHLGFFSHNPQIWGGKPNIVLQTLFSRCIGIAIQFFRLKYGKIVHF